MQKILFGVVPDLIVVLHFFFPSSFPYSFSFSIVVYFKPFNFINMKFVKVAFCVGCKMFISSNADPRDTCKTF